MKVGKSLVELAQELTRIKEAKRDFVVPTERLTAVTTEVDERKSVKLSFTDSKGGHVYGLNSWSAGQLAGLTDIPKTYFDRIHQENPSLLTDNINHGLEKVAKDSRKTGKPDSRMVRTLDGNVRGLLSSRYRILDGSDMLEAVLPTMLEKKMQIISSEVTDRRLYLKAILPTLLAEVKKGDVVRYGLLVSTSDVGAGSVRVEPYFDRLSCLNGMISTTSMRKFHIGKNQAEEDIRELLSDKTRELSDAAFWLSVTDVVLGSLKSENFEKQVDRLRVAANEEIKNFDLPRVVELTMRVTGISGDGKKNSIIAALASGNQGAGLSRWGLINSFTAAAKSDEFTYEESIELERAGGQILELPKSQWSEIASVA